MTMTMTGGGVSSTIQEPPKMKTETMTGGGGGVSSTKTIQEPSKKMKTETGGGVSTNTIQEPLKKIKRKKKMKTVQEPSKKMKTETGGGGGGGVSSTIPEPSKKMKTAAGGGGGVPIEELSPNIPFKSSRLTPIIPFDLNDPDPKVDGVSIKELSLKEMRELMDAVIAKSNAECAKLDVDGAVARFNATCLKAQEVCRQVDIFYHEAMKIIKDVGY